MARHYYRDSLELPHDGGLSKIMNKKLKILALIPARMGSSRFPGKPMEKILGKPMIGRLQGYYSLKVGRYRIIYKVEDDIVVIHGIGHRKDVYEKINN